MHVVARVGGRSIVVRKVSTPLPCSSQPLSHTRLPLHRSFRSICITFPSSLLPAKCSSLTAYHRFRTLVSQSVIYKIPAKRLHTTMEPNGHPRQKRKASPVNGHDRPTKLLRPQRTDTVNSDDSQYMYGSDSVADAMIEPPVATADSTEWQATIEQVVRNVVSIHFCQTCSFDTSAALSSEATGFVVDAARGYILTNRHVVGSGPFWGYCIFDNHEEVSQS